MNDFDDIIGDAVGRHADNAPDLRPAFGDVLASRQQHLRRRSVLGAFGVLAVGATAMAAFAVGGPNESTADGSASPVGSGGVFVTTTAPAFGPPSTVPGEAVWYCEGALDQYAAFPTTTTIAPPTTVAAADDPGSAETVPDGSDAPPLEDSGFFRDCILIEGNGAPVDGDGAYAEQFPTTTTLDNAPDQAAVADPADVVAPASTIVIPPDPEFGSQEYVVRKGDFAIKVADQFCVPVEDLLNFNGWSTGSEFPFPGNTIKIPPGGCAESPSAPCTTPGCDAASIHTVQPGDYGIKIANDYCVALDDIVALNGWESASQGFPFPGQQVLIPPPVTTGVCPTNGES